VVAKTGLQAVLAKRVHSLSKGFNRRLMLALGLLAPHPLLLMDEPFDGFDLKQAREMMPVLRAEAAQGRTLLLSIHQLTDAERICDRFILLSAGEVRGTGTLDELRARAGVPDAGLEEVFLALA
jgi:ABC-2 type transport system ATP-binding protein